MAHYITFRTPSPSRLKISGSASIRCAIGMVDMSIPGHPVATPMTTMTTMYT